MTQIIVSNNPSGFTFTIIFSIIFLSLFLYLAITTHTERSFHKQMKKAKKMIEEGHKKALVGKKDDGLYMETKILLAQADLEAHKPWEEMLMEGVELDDV